VKTFLQNLIKEEIKKILEDVPRDADENDIFGKYLWADNKRPPKRLDGAPKERNTSAEDELFSLFTRHISGDRSAMKIAIGQLLRPLKAQGKYLKFIASPEQLVYRGMHNMSVQKAAKMLNVSEDAIKENSGGKIKTNAIVGGTKHVVSWTIDKNIANIFAGYKKEGHEIDVGLVLVADPYEGNNDFYLNPENISKTFGNIGQYKSEKETVSYGPVMLKYAYLIEIV